MVSSMAHDTDTGTSTSTGTKSNNTYKKTMQLDKYNGVIDGTISMMWQETCYCHVCAKN